MNEDFQDLLIELLDGEVRFLVVGAHAMAVHACRERRATWMFGSDLLTDRSGLDFDEAWRNRTMHSFGPCEIPFLGREDLIRNKRASSTTSIADRPESNASRARTLTSMANGGERLTVRFAF